MRNTSGPPTFIIFTDGRPHRYLWLTGQFDDGGMELATRTSRDTARYNMGPWEL